MEAFLLGYSDSVVGPAENQASFGLRVTSNRIACRSEEPRLSHLLYAGMRLR